MISKINHKTVTHCRQRPVCDIEQHGMYRYDIRFPKLLAALMSIL